MNKQSLLTKGLLFAVMTFSLVSCDKDFNTIGSDIVGENYFDFDKTEYEVVAENVMTGAVQSNNLELNSLGVYTNGVFGKTASHFVTQVELPSTGKNFGINQEIDSVWLYVPIFSEETGTDSEGVKTYKRKSVYGDDQKFKLRIYENGYYLGDYDQNDPQGVARHYSDEKAKVENNKRGHDGSGGSIVNGMYLNDSDNQSENLQFWFDPKEHVIYKTDGMGQYVNSSGVVLDDQTDISARVVVERFTPGIWVNLNKEFFKKRILQAPADKLLNNNAFKEYFRGLYFQVEEIEPGQGAKAILDFSKGFVRIEYSAEYDLDNNPETDPVRQDKTFRMNLKGNTINFFDTDYTLPVSSDRLYLNGGSGSVAYIDVFGADGPDEGTKPDNLEDIIAKKWLINEANLTFYIDNSATMMGMSTYEPDRIYLYDAKNKKPIADYYADASVNSSNPKLNKKGYGGIIEKDADERGIKYKIRITEYLKSCIKNADSTNYRLGLVVTENINTISNAYLRPLPGQLPQSIVPVSSVINPLGTILHGPTSTDIEKRLKLEIYYTKPD
ncbi:DUF4270 domain-containing protein [Flavobacterium suncheonense]|uniref:DUF4270 domain-containing protein n=1 Tax=Flavobacterium suncheonense GH29-5 = DSM 17707 TaxID=1121899 RepID=A0A0A2MLU3_9FLAO|nr:DUF4270 domain-containing protein [Flavobacterium suncheonense]KGO89240.1 hypothetical protein Q764_09240 [Flavobacterium suncheonense GH29-5 = DSM 17707]